MSNSIHFFVLEHKFLGEKNGANVAEIRRVRLPRIVKGVSYEQLGGFQNPSCFCDFEFKLAYQDVDDDAVVIGSSEELLDVIEQISEQRVPKMTAQVTPQCSPDGNEGALRRSATTPAKTILENEANLVLLGNLVQQSWGNIG
ncbi:expressed unknown protein [Seminavis robusta]|uniref:PB1 domain-containing protein n=1 Tax=Seminavis robusta TaxID=568900 RepID=A0A9N8H744_9STRA|nr:expressed unknown protein [Seminavis robusta]|eukprot:Sro118_g057820.1 n/a (143) ;mRNA; f:84065-84588